MVAFHWKSCSMAGGTQPRSHVDGFVQSIECCASFGLLPEGTVLLTLLLCSSFRECIRQSALSLGLLQTPGCLLGRSLALLYLRFGFFYFNICTTTCA